MKKIILFFYLFTIFANASEIVSLKTGSAEKTIAETDINRFADIVIIRALNKITGKTFEIKTKVGEIVEFEKLKIVPLKCWKSYPEEEPENKLLLKILERDIQNNEKLIFYGWIFSSSSSISGLEHSMYDIILNNCEKENVSNN